MNKITIYGKANCDTIKKTLDWYKNKNIAVEFHDYKKLGISAEKLRVWSKKLGYEVLLNKKSTTWRSLSKEEQQKVTGEAEAIDLMTKFTSLIKRPVVEINDNVIVGFNEANFKDSSIKN